MSDVVGRIPSIDDIEFPQITAPEIEEEEKEEEEQEQPSTGLPEGATSWGSDPASDDIDIAGWGYEDTTREETERKRLASEALAESIDQMEQWDPNEAAKMKNALVYSQKLRIPYEQAYRSHDAISEAWFKATKPPKSIWESFVDGFNAGWAQEELHDRWSWKAFGFENVAGNEERIKEIDSYLTGLSPEQKSEWSPNIGYNTGAFIPNILSGMKEGGWYALGLMGITAAGTYMTAGMTSPQLIATAASFGMTMGVASHSFRQMTGSLYKDLSQIEDANGRKMPPALARTFAITGGALNAALETSQGLRLLKTIPGAEQLITGAATTAFMTQTAKRSYGKIMKDSTLRYASFVVSETAEEMGQRYIDDWATETAKFLAQNGDPTYEFEYKQLVDYIKGIAQEGLATVVPIMLMGLPGTAMSTTMDLKTQSNKNKIDTGQRILQQVIDQRKRVVDVQAMQRITIPKYAYEPGTTSQDVPEGAPFRGTVIDPQTDERVPDVVYHVTTATEQVQADGKIKALGAGGLGGDPKDGIVSFTTSREVAQQLEADLKLAVEVAQLNERTSKIGQRAGESSVIVERLGAQAEQEGWVFGPHAQNQLDNYTAKDWLIDYFNQRDFRNGTNNPIILSDLDTLRNVDADQISILEVKKESLDNGALFTDFDLDNERGLSEIRSYGDVLFQKKREPAIKPAEDAPALNITQDPAEDLMPTETLAKRDIVAEDPAAEREWAYLAAENAPYSSKLQAELKRLGVPDHVKVYKGAETGKAAIEPGTIDGAYLTETEAAVPPEGVDPGNWEVTEFSVMRDDIVARGGSGRYYAQMPTPRLTLESFNAKIKRAIPSLTTNQLKAVNSLIKRSAKYLGMTPDQFVGDTISDVAMGGSAESYDLFQSYPENKAIFKEALDQLTAEEKKVRQKRGLKNPKPDASWIQNAAIEHYARERFGDVDWEHYAQEMTGFVKSMNRKTSSGETTIHFNGKTMLSIDVSTDCPFRQAGIPCIYCYVEEGRIVEAMGKKSQSNPKKVLVAIPYDNYIETMPDELVRFINTELGGLRMFSFGDFEVNHAANRRHIDQIIQAATEKGLIIKAITKQEGFIQAYADHPNVRINISTDWEHATGVAAEIRDGFGTGTSLKGIVSRAVPIEEAAKWKEGRENVKIRYVALNMEDALDAGADPRVDVITFHHGAVRKRLADIWRHSHSYLFETLGPKTVNELANEITDKAGFNVVMEKFPDKLCCQTGKCVTCPIACGFADTDISGRLDILQQLEDGVPSAAIHWANDGRALMAFFETADVTSVVHELAHNWRRLLPDEDQQVIEQWLGVENGQWTAAQEEAFAYGLEQYLETREPPAPGRSTMAVHLNRVFSQFRDWFRDIINELRNEVQLTPEAVAVYDRLFGREEEIFPTRRTSREIANPLLELGRRGLATVDDIELFDNDSRTVETYVSESEALKGSMKAQVRAAEAGAKAQREIQRERNLEARKRKEMNKMINGLKRVMKGLKKMDSAFKEPIEQILGALQLTTPSKKTIWKLEQMRNYLENNPEAEIPQKTLDTLKRLDQKPIREMTMADVKDVYNSVMHYVHLNKTKQGIRIRNQQQNFETAKRNIATELAQPITEIAVVENDARVAGKTVGDRMRRIFGIGHDHYDLIVEKLAGARSATFDVLYRKVKDGIRKQLRYRQKAFSDFERDLAEEGFTLGTKDFVEWSEEQVQVGKFNLTRGERMALFRHTLDADNRRAIIEGGFGFKRSSEPNRVHNITEEELVAILDSLTDKELAFAGDAVTNLFRRQGEEMNEVFKRKNGYDLELRDLYYPKEVMPITRDSDLEKEEALEKLRGQFVRVGVSKGMLEARLGSKKPIYLNDISYDINKSVFRASAYIGLEEPLSLASRVLYSNEVHAAISAYQDGDLIWKEIEKGLQDIAGDYRAYTELEDAMVKLRGFFTTSVLGLNPFVIIKQPLSYAMGSVYIKAEYMTTALADVAQNGKEIEERLMAISPELVERLQSGFSRDVKDVIRSRQAKSPFGPKEFREKLTAGIQLFDKWTVIPIMHAGILQALDEFEAGSLSPEVAQALDMSDAQAQKLNPDERMAKAAEFADWVVERTQPSFAPEHQAPIQRGTALEKQFTMFSSFTNQALNLMRRSYANMQREGTAASKKQFARAVISVMVINTLGNAGVDTLRDWLYGREREKGAFLGKILSSWAGMFFVVRDAVSSLVSKVQRGKFSGYDVSLPVLQVIDKTLDVASDLIRLLSDDTPKKRRKAAESFIDGAAEMILLSRGIPYRTPKNIVKRIIGE